MDVPLMNEVIFSFVPKQRLQSVLETLYNFTGLSLRLLDEQGSELASFGPSANYCRLLHETVIEQSVCDALHRRAGQNAREQGEAYVFACHAGAYHISFPLLNQGELLGSVLVGPFLMDEPDAAQVGDLGRKYRLEPQKLLELYDALGHLAILEPQRVTQLCKLLDHLLSPLLPAERALLLQAQEKLYQQSRINETIQMYKAQSLTPSQNFFYEKETQLLTKVKTGDIAAAKALLNELIGYVLFSEGGKLQPVRVHAIELTTLLARVALEGGANAQNIFALNSRFVLMLGQEQSLDELCYVLQEVVESFMSATFYQRDKGNAHIRQALSYMSQNYQKALTMPAVAEKVGLSPNYFSALFQKIVGESFREHLCRIRVEESKHLLLATNYPLGEIALAMGFADQSYYCKVFKRIVGVTPGQYRS